jgi:aconitate hydratase
VVEKFAAGRKLKVRAGTKEFEALVRIDTPQEALYYANGGILQYVLRQLMTGSRETVGAYDNR